MLGDDSDHVRREDRDHFLLARGFLKSCEAEFNDVREWIQQEILVVKVNAQLMEETAQSNLVQEKVRAVLQRVTQIDLKELRECVTAIEGRIQDVNNRKYSDVFGVHTQLEMGMMPLRDLVRQLLGLRNTLDLLQTDMDDSFSDID